MIFGYPGTTNEYLPSHAIRQLTEVENPHKIAIRTAKLNVMNEAMDRSELTRIKYAAKAAGVANAWKKWQGEIKGLKRFHTIGNKEKQEAEFAKWAEGNKRYEGITERYRDLYARRENLIRAYVYASEAGLRGAEIVGLAEKVRSRVSKSVERKNRQHVKRDCIRRLPLFQELRCGNGPADFSRNVAAVQCQSACGVDSGRGGESPANGGLRPVCGRVV